MSTIIGKVSYCKDESKALFTEARQGLSEIIGTVSFVRLNEKTETIVFGLPINVREFTLWTTVSTTAGEKIAKGDRVKIILAKVDYVINANKMSRIELDITAKSYCTACASSAKVIVDTEHFD